MAGPIPPGQTGHEELAIGTGSGPPPEGGGIDSVDPIDPCASSLDIVGILPGADPDCLATVLTIEDFPTEMIDQSEGTTYTTYFIEPHWEEDYHTLQMPVASTAITNASFAVVAQPTMRKRVSWSAEKLGDWPELPIAETDDPNEILLRKNILGKNVEFMGDESTPVYTITGEYIYGLVTPIGVQFYIGVMPFTSINVAESAIPQDNFVSGIASP